MKFSLTIGLLGIFALTACEIDEPPPRRNNRPAPKYPQQTQSQYPAQPQPFQDGTQTTTTTTTQPNAPAPEVAAENNGPAPAQNPAPKAKGDYPYAVPVPGKPGFVRSPYSPDKMTDVRGYAPGTEVKDPYTQKIFLVP
ncbi:MAG: hypothetical protein M3R10_07100 [Verrucomicrobiota bacterium]|nr:hypothetical protein [Verrucomicrobiota bacterium]